MPEDSASAQGEMRDLGDRRGEFLVAQLQNAGGGHQRCDHSPSDDVEECPENC
jgi:hypothetical protein